MTSRRYRHPAADGWLGSEFAAARPGPAARKLLVVGAVSLGLACGVDSGGGPTPPGRPVQQVAFGDSVADSLAAGDTLLRYAVHPPLDADWAVYFQVTAGNPALLVRDSVTGTVITTLSAPGASRPLLGYRTRLMPGGLGHTYLIEVRPATRGAVRFRLLAYQTNPAPESRGDTVTVGPTYSGESLATSADVDEFHFSGQAGDLVVAELQGQDGQAPGALSLSITDTAGSATPLVQLSNVADSLGLAGAAATLTLPRSGRFLVTVTGVAVPPAPGLLGSGRYQFRFAYINTAPESGSSILTGRDSVDGRLDDVADLDEFTYTAVAGDQFRLFVRSFAPQGTGQGVVAQVIDPAGLVVARVVAPGLTQSIFDYNSPLFTTPAGGTYRVRIQGARPSSLGPYRFLFFRLSPGPERVSGALVAGDTVAGESIDVPGDSDAYTIAAQAGQWVNLCLQFIGPAYSIVRLTATLTGPTGALLGSVASFPDTTALLPHTAKPIQLPATGTYSVRVTSDGPTTLGAYRLLLAPIDSRPEALPLGLALDDSLVGERLDVPQDIDEFTVNLQAGERIRPFLGGVAGLRITFFKPDGTLLIGNFDYSSPMPVTGSYRVRVQGDDPIAIGPYWLYLYRIDPRPERFTGTLAAGDSMTVETVERPSDIDSFAVHLPAADALSIRVRGSAASGNSSIGLLAPDGSILGGVLKEVDQGDGTYLALTGLIPLAGQSSASLRLIPDPYAAGGSPYAIILDSISYGVETRSDTMTPGEVVSEALTPLGDVDRYVFRGLVNQSFNLVFDTLPGSFTPTTLDLLYPYVTHTAPRPGGGRETGRFDLPSSGLYELRLSTPASGLDPLEQGPYRFILVPSDTMPEHDPPVIVTGDSASISDGLDTPGDLDRFTFTSIADTEFALDISPAFPPLGYLPYLDVQLLAAAGDSATVTLTADSRLCTAGYGNPYSLGPSGIARIQVRESRGAEPPQTTGSYGVTVHAVHRPPETLGVALVVDSLYVGEKIDNCGDIDEFRYTGVTGDSLIAYVSDVPLNTPPFPPHEVVQIVDPTTNQVIADDDPDQFAYPGATVKIALPHDGEYVIRVWGVAGRQYMVWLRR